MMDKHEPGHVAVALAAHTNAGKTTLARTLLGRDVGVVEDGAHTTRIADSYTWIESDSGDRLLLWDTPGFGDSRRLFHRLQGSEARLARFLTEQWDRLTDPGLFYSQRALRNLRDEADCVLYLINCSESPDKAGYLDAEMQLLLWLNKPVIVLLNQSGDALEDGATKNELQQWRQQIAQDYPWVRAALSLDAFSRCWVQEFALLEVISAALPTRSMMELFRSQWIAEQAQRFQQAIETIAQLVCRCALAMQPLEPDPERLLARLRPQLSAHRTEAAARLLGLSLADQVDQMQRALVALYELDAGQLSTLLDALDIELHGGQRVDEHRLRLAASIISGIGGGLLADLASGGLSLGGGMLAGATLGAAAGHAAGLGLNRLRNAGAPVVEWNHASLDAIVTRALTIYLVVSHSGRGRGEVMLQTDTVVWQQALAEAMRKHSAAFHAAWQQRQAARADDHASAAFTATIAALLSTLAQDLLSALYPDQPLPFAAINACQRLSER